MAVGRKPACEKQTDISGLMIRLTPPDNARSPIRPKEQFHRCFDDCFNLASGHAGRRGRREYLQYEFKQLISKAALLNAGVNVGDQQLQNRAIRRMQHFGLDVGQPTQLRNFNNSLRVNDACHTAVQLQDELALRVEIHAPGNTFRRGTQSHWPTRFLQSNKLRQIFRTGMTNQVRSPHIVTKRDACQGQQLRISLK